jgi:hypothetical protein
MKAVPIGRISTSRLIFGWCWGVEDPFFFILHSKPNNFRCIEYKIGRTAGQGEKRERAGFDKNQLEIRKGQFA